MSKNRINYFEKLWEKYRSNDLSSDEFEEFVQFLAEKENSVEELDRISKEEWKDSKEILEQIRIAQNRKDHRSVLLSWVWGSAAAVVLLLGSIWFFWSQEIPEDIVFYTGYGETKNIELPDGSKVLLNANSKIIWDGAWEKVGLRSVELEGEAFFDVVGIDAMHFEVNTADVKVDVKGTQFNVKQRGGETDVFLHSGKVYLEIAGALFQTLEMDPGDFVKYDDLEKKLTSSNHRKLGEKASWVDGMLEFRNERISKILKEFENLYGKTFSVKDDEVLEKRLDLSLPYANWDLIQRALEIALDVKFTITNDTIIVE